MVPWIASDLIVTRAVADALMFRPKQNPYYDPATALAVARDKKQEFNERVEQMSGADNNKSAGCNVGLRAGRWVWRLGDWVSIFSESRYLKQKHDYII